MILNFMTTWPEEMPGHLAGKPTYFVEKIYSALKEVKIDESVGNYMNSEFYNPLINIMETAPKLHTIRFMTPERAKQWEGKMIDFYINHRTKNSLRFAPRVPVVSVQRIGVRYNSSLTGDVLVRVSTESKLQVFNRNRGDCDYPSAWIEDLVINDGFSNLNDFCSYFNAKRIADKEAEGKFPYIIHWTDLKY